MAKLKKILSLVLALIMVLILVSCGNDPIETSITTNATTNASEIIDIKNKVLYVATTGSDNNDGSEENPFATIEKARNTIRTLNKDELDSITVIIDDGEYRVDSIDFTKEDSGTESCKITYIAKNQGAVVINGGVTLDPAAFEPITDETMLNRLSEAARSKVVCLDLGTLGITAEDYGKLYAIGSYCTANKYDGDYVGGIYCELFYNDSRMNLARYPNASNVKTGMVIKEGDSYEHSDANHVKTEGWADRRNHESDIYSLGAALAQRMASWATFDDVWVYGCFMYDWADSSSPIGYFDLEKREWSPLFVSRYGTKQGASYYYYNVFEELDTTGEWYLDRTTGILYLYQGDDFANATIDLSLTTDSLIQGLDVSDIVLDGFTFKGTRGDAITLTGDNNLIQNCTIKNVAGNAIVVTGFNNLVFKNEITRTGKGGIILSGGVTETLTAGNNKAENNLIHDWAEIYTTYQPAVTLLGVGNICSHNEMYNTPHEAITYKGNNHIIEYNYIHEVCLKSTDAGAIYAGNSWVYYGNVIRYNFLWNIGSGSYTANGIYLDDALSGQTVVGNIIVNAKGYALTIGGGRDNTIENNVIVNYAGGKRSISYDSRAIDSYDGGWFTGSLEGGHFWETLAASPYKTELWQNAYPQMADFYTEFDDLYNPNFVPNPANSTVRKNLIVNTTGSIGYMSSIVQRYSKVGNNKIYSSSMLSTLFEDFSKGNYSIKEDAPVWNDIPGFEKIDFDAIGRY